MPGSAESHAVAPPSFVAGILLLAVVIAAPPAAAREAALAALVLPTADRFEPVHRFGGRTEVMEFALYPTTREALELRGRLFQQGGRLAVPFGPVFEIPFARRSAAKPGDALPISAPLALPDVERESDFELRVFARLLGSEDWQPAGRIGLRVYPSDRLAPLRRFAQTHRLQIQRDKGEEDDRLARFLDERDIAFSRPGDTPRSASGPVVRVRVEASDRGQANAKFVPTSPDDLVVLFRDSALTLPHLLVEHSGSARRVTAPRALLDRFLGDRLASDPLAHDTLLRIFELLEDSTP